MKWRRFALHVKDSDVEVASAILSAAGGAAVAVDEAGFDRKRPLVSVFVPLAKAARTRSALRSALAKARRDGLLSDARLSSTTIGEEDWATSWKRYFKPSLLAKGLYVVPSWHKNFRPPRQGRSILLDPGMAFGTGQHATTKMALRLLLPYVRPRKPMIDVGCGSGILAIAAAQLGARAYACDNDPIATKATGENFARNRLRPAAILRASGVPPSFPRSPLIVANITADILAALAPVFARKLEDGGALITSGVTKRGCAPLLRAFARGGLHRVREEKSGEWIAFAHVKDAR